VPVEPRLRQRASGASDSSSKSFSTRHGRQRASCRFTIAKRQTGWTIRRSGGVAVASVPTATDPRHDEKRRTGRPAVTMRACGLVLGSRHRKPSRINPTPATAINRGRPLGRHLASIWGRRGAPQRPPGPEFRNANNHHRRTFNSTRVSRQNAPAAEKLNAREHDRGARGGGEQQVQNATESPPPPKSPTTTRRTERKLITESTPPSLANRSTNRNNVVGFNRVRTLETP